MAILSYPILFYRSKIEMEMNFEIDLRKLGITNLYKVEKAIQEKVCFPNNHFTVIITKVVRSVL